MTRRLAIMEAIRRRPITLVAAAYGTDGSLHQHVITGPEPASSCLPDEGLYILYRSVGLLIASKCKRQVCIRTQVCRCSEQQRQPQQQQQQQQQQFVPIGITATITSTVSRAFRQSYVSSWFHFDEATEVIPALGLCFLAHPQSLSWADDNDGVNDTDEGIFDGPAFYFDARRRHHHQVFPPTVAGRGGQNRERAQEERLMDVIRDSWEDFVNSRDHGFNPAVTLTGHDDDHDADNDWENGDPGDLASWDDTDVPIPGDLAGPDPLRRSGTRPQPRSGGRDVDTDFDLIDDLIEEFRSQRPGRSAR